VGLDAGYNGLSHGITIDKYWIVHPPIQIASFRLRCGDGSNGFDRV
jgi:hypothetical protein